ncbi:Uncharacterized protein OBRU01_03884 [Operophtera brumata]|uniref:Nitroreductase domain-containing protein n=1 Tax=Operophtera brumata TaxID=104452 RepID=A0A0L7LQ80_OPEBR|nr:Uncharacterized protein OBRU01_03884 [Operophtera brumata]
MCQNVNWQLLPEEREFPDEDDDPDLLVPAIAEDTPQVPYQPPKRSDYELLQRSQEYYELMAKRRTVRSFSQETIPQEVLDNIIRTAGTAPSGAHTEPWTFVVVQDKETKEAIRYIVEEEEELNYTMRMSRQWVTDLKPFATKPVKPYLTDAPVLLLYCGLVALTSTPLNCSARLRDLLSRPATERLELLLPIGRPHEDCTVPDLQRKALDEIIVRA